MEHSFTKQIKIILKESFPDVFQTIFERSELIQYLNIKTKAANRGSKSRASFANLYAIYVLVEDYIAKDFHNNSGYSDYEGAAYSNLLSRQRQLPFGQKLQNHALNHRLNEEFKRYFPLCDFIPILRNPKTKRYWFNENLLKFLIDNKEYNISQFVVKIIEAYVAAKRDSFETFIQLCETAQSLTQ